MKREEEKKKQLLATESRHDRIDSELSIKDKMLLICSPLAAITGAVLTYFKEFGDYPGNYNQYLEPNPHPGSAVPEDLRAAINLLLSPAVKNWPEAEPVFKKYKLI